MSCNLMEADLQQQVRVSGTAVPEPPPPSPDLPHGSVASLRMHRLLNVGPWLHGSDPAAVAAMPPMTAQIAQITCSMPTSTRPSAGWRTTWRFRSGWSSRCGLADRLMWPVVKAFVSVYGIFKDRFEINLPGLGWMT